MKKQTALTVALALALGVGAQAVASAAPYNDVPSSAKESVDKLYKDGLLDNKSQKFGPSDKVSRVEMAKLVAEAMTKLEKADAQQKAMIKKLAAEFKPELDAMKADVDGVKGDINTINGRLDGVEKKLGEKQNVTFNGYVRQRLESSDAVVAPASPTNVKDNTLRTRVRLDMTAPLDGNFTFKGRYEFNALDTSSSWTNGAVNLSQAYIVGKAFGMDAVLAGRVPLVLGQGLVANIQGKESMTAPEAFAVATHVDKVNIVAGVGRVSLNGLSLWDATLATPAFASQAAVSHNVSFLNVAAPVADGLNLTASYLKDKANAVPDAYKTTAFGLSYTGLDKFTITGETAQNKSTVGNDAKAYYYQVKYLGAKKAQQGTYGVWAQYRNADAGFDVLGLSGLDATLKQQATTVTNTIKYAGPADNLKGLEFGIEYTAFKNGVLTFKYEGLKQKSSDQDKKAYIGQLELFF